MMTSPALASGPLSWQQESVVRSAATCGRECLWTAFEIPSDVSNDELISRLGRLVRREHSLRIVAVDPAGVGYADAIELPIRYARCSGPGGVPEFVARNKHVEFASGRPRWQLTIIDHRDPAGRPARSALAVFDFMIADMFSLALLRQELCTGVAPSAKRGAGRYREWVVRQRAEFDVDAVDAVSTARAFWDEHLGGASPSGSTPLPGVDDAAPDQVGGTVWLSVPVPMSAADLAAAARRAKATPYTLAVASVAATIATGTAEDDVTLRVINSGRVPDAAATFGRLATSTPIRLNRPGLAGFDVAVAEVRAAWRRVLPHQHTPWEYLRTVCAGRGVTEWEAAGQRQLVVNFFPAPADGLGAADFADKRADLRMTHVELLVVPLVSGGFMFRMMCDSGDLDVESVRRFLHVLADGFTAHVRTVLSEDGRVPEPRR
ncbi:hypothetical protein GCM10022254_55430 [Actinomadura meridiana]|uniref:Condensation domain-containing protein n=1 Tax=Actinomadura meridiana TaxID=559626 RepID=A0ABP8CG43_9ACTN